MTGKNKKTLVIVSVVLLVLLVGWRLMFGGNDAVKNAQRGPAGPVQVQAVILSESSGRGGVRVTGTLLPDEQVELRSETGGRIVEVHFEEGAKVAKGQLLVKIDDRELRAQLQRGEAELKLAISEAERREHLESIGGISREEYEQSYTRIQTIRAEQEGLRALISRTSIYAPFSGRVGLRNVSPGSYVTSQDVLATLQKTDPVKVEFNVPERYASAVRTGMPVNMEVTGAGITQAVIYAMDPGIDPVTRTIRVRARASNSAGLLLPGSFAEVNLPVGLAAEGLAIPSEALISEIDGNKVLVVKEGKAVKVPVEAGERGPRLVYLTSGVKSGDTLIITGLLTLREGAPVTAVITDLPGNNR